MGLGLPSWVKPSPEKATKCNNPIVAEITKLTSQVSQLTGLHSGLKGEMENLKREFQGSRNLGSFGWVPPTPMGPLMGAATGQEGEQLNNTPPVKTPGNLPSSGRGRGNSRGRGGSGGRGGQNRAFGSRMGCDTCVQLGVFCRHCLQCGEEGHRFFECPRCPLCNEEGHRSNACPKKNGTGEQD